MIMRLILIFCILIPTLIFGQSSATDSLNQVDKKGKKQGTWIKKYPNNKTIYSGQFKDDKPIGTFIYYDNYGTLSSKLTHTKNDTSHALFYHDGVSLMSEGKYYKQQRTGIWKQYDGQGDITSQCIYVNGKKNCMERIYYKDGRVSREVNYKGDILDGVIKEFFSNGRVKFSGIYQDGNLNGEVEWFQSGGAKKLHGHYKYAVQVNAWTYYDSNSKPTRIEFYKEGRLLWTKTPVQLRAEKELRKQKQDSLNSATEIKE